MSRHRVTQVGPLRRLFSNQSMYLTHLRQVGSDKSRLMPTGSVTPIIAAHSYSKSTTPLVAGYVTLRRIKLNVIYQIYSGTNGRGPF